MRTVLSALLVAASGRVGCGAVCHVRSREGGLRSLRGDMLHLVVAMLFSLFYFFFRMSLFIYSCPVLIWFGIFVCCAVVICFGSKVK